MSCGKKYPSFDEAHVYERAWKLLAKDFAALRDAHDRTTYDGLLTAMALAFQSAFEDEQAAIRAHELEG